MYILSEYGQNYAYRQIRKEFFYEQQFLQQPEQP